jgi:hypothetical protein
MGGRDEHFAVLEGCRRQAFAWSTEYRASKGSDLLAKEGLPKFTGKGSDRIRRKTFQQSCEGETLQFERVFEMSGPPVPTLRRTDMYVSTLRKYIEAMGGQLDIIARFPEGAVRIRQFQELGADK